MALITLVFVFIYAGWLDYHSSSLPSFAVVLVPYAIAFDLLLVTRRR